MALNKLYLFHLQFGILNLFHEGIIKHVIFGPSNVQVLLYQ